MKNQPVEEASHNVNTSVSQSKQVRTFKIHGMDCAEEVIVLKRVLSNVVPEHALSFDVLTSRMTVHSDVNDTLVMEAVANTGMRAEPWTTSHLQTTTRNSIKNRELLVIVSVIATIVGFSLHAGLEGVTAAIGSEGIGLAHGVPWIARIVYLIAVAAGLWVVLPKAWYALRSLRPDMNLLMTVAVAGAITLGEWFEAATVSSLFALSLALEAWSVGRARRAVEALMSLAPDTVRVRTEDGKDREIDPAKVAVGTIFTVLPGERIGLDGYVKSGRTEVDQAPITGESMPVEKKPGDQVFAGTINTSGAIEVVSTHPAGETTLSRIVKQVADSQKNRAESERFVERFARIYTPMIFASAIMVALVPPLFFGGVWIDWIYRSLVLLVIGCPCALVISTPVAIVASLASSARQGILLKGGRVAELPAKLKVVALDKTGTLTHGRPTVVTVVPFGELDERTLLGYAAGLEMMSTHPIATAILRRAEEMEIDVVSATDVLAIHGKGIEGRIAGQLFWLGSRRWLEERGQDDQSYHKQLDLLSSKGQTLVVVGDEEHVYGLIAVMDEIRTESRDALIALRSNGVRSIIMLTGDNAVTANAVAEQVGVDSVYSELLPEDKAAIVDQLQRNIGPVAMIGDGINDAPALARATLGIAMGAVGTDVAIETADIALMSDDLSKLAWLIEHSHKTLAVIRWNTALALGIKVVFVILTFTGIATLWGAVAADIGASLLVVFNALRLLKQQG